MTRFGTFWHGPALTPFEAACLHSFVARGHEITLFSYEPVAGVPDGVRLQDAREIVGPEKLSSFLVDGAPSISHFSDYFRYVMFSRSELTWVDTDVFLLRGWTQDPDRTLLALETPKSICNAVMRIATGERWLPELVSRTEALADTPMRWGQTGPKLITELVGGSALLMRAEPQAVHFPIHWDDFWTVFLPEHADACRAACADARTLHLWNNIVERLGFWKEFLPPEGSYLHELFVASGSGGRFRGVFPLKNVRQMIENWQSRQSGRHLGIGSVARQVLPSIRRTIRHHVG